MAVGWSLDKIDGCMAYPSLGRLVRSGLLLHVGPPSTSLRRFRGGGCESCCVSRPSRGSGSSRVFFSRGPGASRVCGCHSHVALSLLCSAAFAWFWRLTLLPRVVLVLRVFVVCSSHVALSFSRVPCGFAFLWLLLFGRACPRVSLCCRVSSSHWLRSHSLNGSPLCC